MTQINATIPPIMTGKQYVNAEQEDQMEIQGYVKSRRRHLVTWICIVLTAGLLRLIFHWKPEWMLKCTHTPCSLQCADTILLKDQYKEWFVERVVLMTKDGTRVKVVKSSASFFSNPNEQEGQQARVEIGSGAGLPSGEQHSPLLTYCDDSLIRYFVNKKIKYLWDPVKHDYEKLKGLEEGQPCSYFHETDGLSPLDQARIRVLYGYNSIRVHVTSILRLLGNLIVNPFYVFQLFSVIVWFNDEYEYYASCIILISAISLTVSVYETRKMQRALKNTVTGSGIVTVSRDDKEFQDVPSDLLVPGDVIEVPRHGCIMQCDAVLISGNCIVNESMLTGESVPVTKTPIPNQQEVIFDMKDHGRHVLFCGTHVIQTRYYGSQRVKAVVLRTGFSTAKGELVRSIMFPKPVDFKFSQDSYKFIGVLALIASIGMFYTMILMGIRGDDPSQIVLRTLDLVTIVIPPALPAAMTVGIVFAQNRLKRKRVFCISPRSINLCGAINTFCFDKTGTLTEDGLDMWGLLPTDQKSYQFHDVVQEAKMLPKTSAFLAGMATCHSLTIIEGQITGDPLDLKMFESTNWNLEEPGEDTARFDIIMPTVVRPRCPDIVQDSVTYGNEEIPFEIGILRQFTFSSRLQRMSVIARTLDSSHFDLYAKGAPEMIASLCKQETVPSDFHTKLMYYTQQGYRVIALAWRPLHKMTYVKVQRAEREQMEKDLIFLGLLVMENRLKPQTTPIIHELKDANIRTIMVTGDNMLTALSVARDCHMVPTGDKVILVHVVPPIANQTPKIEWTYAEDANQTKTFTTPDSFSIEFSDSDNIHLAITGKCWDLIRKYFPEIMPKLAVKGTVFARMSPEQKAQLIELLQQVGYYVGMCGDGANDCGALKTAHTGISLSEAEASVASPFTSKEPNISCVPTVIKEGRAALVTSFGVFKYMACYSLTQFASVCMLYWGGANLTDFGFLWIDLFLLTTLSISFGYTGAYPDLYRKSPAVSLISFTPILSIVIQLVVIILTQLTVWFIVRAQPWFEAYVPNDDDDYACHEVTTLFLISSYQYIALAVVLSKGAPYRKTILSNYYFVGNLMFCLGCTVYINMYPFQWLNDLLEMVLPPSLEFRALLIGIAAVNFFVCFILEMAVDSDFIQKNIQEPLTKRSVNFEYIKIEEEMRKAPEWPPRVSKSTSNLAELMRLESAANNLDDVVKDEGGEGDAPKKKRSRKKSRSRTESGGSGRGARAETPSKNSPSVVVGPGQVQFSVQNEAFVTDQSNDIVSHYLEGALLPKGDGIGTNGEVVYERGDSILDRGDSIENAPLFEGAEPVSINLGSLQSESTVL